MAERPGSAAEWYALARGGLCADCVHARLVVGRRSRFLRCDAEGPPRYPRLPVRACPHHRPRAHNGV